MGRSPSSSALVVVVLVVLAAAVACSATRPVPTQQQQAVSSSAAARRGTLQEEEGVTDTTVLPDTLQEGTVLIPGLGRIEIGSHYVPDLGGLDHSIPAATHAQFIPGADDTWVPNPGFEVPNPFQPGAATP